MRTREEVAREMERALQDLNYCQPVYPKFQWHIGYCELRRVLDYIYGGPPTTPMECIRNEREVEKAQA